MPGLLRIFRSYPRTNDDAIDEPLRDWYPANVRADLEKYGVEKLLAQERDDEGRIRDMWDAIELFVRWYVGKRDRNTVENMWCAVRVWRGCGVVYWWCGQWQRREEY